MESWRVEAEGRGGRRFCRDAVGCPEPNPSTKEGRHVGLDFYDLLIEALIDLKFHHLGTCLNMSLCRPG